ncbi:hypothetical protein [Saccharomonospora viridis]|jgi:hypothetical protein|uniref:Uncharacterized protein n=2 Tax=Saccharomonospora viridis TaxID=1852 RepID=C7MR42_SACVD|nr:hypothetical protein [Saccharomonospora viridis]ACU98628.1 hypothetical protein Svir_36780 [Saccharomonospora viridis DSM 43017]KHF44416.1 hypothetical protein MINT15_12980 [Saccharomonospora viridis]SFP64127.1 hypothetical protein SAMN02982918_2972 [Saccharomonospora viridis]
MSLEQLRHLLAGTLDALSTARSHNVRARELLDDYRRVVTEVQAQAQPWLPRELDSAVEQIEANDARLDTVYGLLTSYDSRL